MAPFGLMFSGVCLLKKSFSLFSHASSLTRPPVWTGAGACWTVNSSRFVNVIPAVKSLTTIAGAPPKRPLNGYMRFVKQQQPLVVREYPDVKAVDVIRKIAQQWRTLTADQKQPFQQASVVAREQFKVDMQRYQSQLTPAQAAALKQERRLRLAKRKAIRRKRELNSLGKPKRPRSSFNIFMAEHFEESRGTTTQGKMKMLREDWTKLSTSQKQVYMQLAEDDKVRYKNEMKSWEEHMMDIGREDLIRRKETHKNRTATKGGKQKSKVKVVKTKSARATTVRSGKKA
ncbi:transcription factor A, mitochondrial isoform X1 [Oncorhynchus kisutch]|uniref:Transcription factor A, mitochondrial n=1 Tax=Oncorhynchus kisutch TaxID=8019 RepID=A0A8C7CS43_ONCKI|nr:transcription factor A, mitochondrial isoform X1 [Oncorhynchus kisutch]XP_031651271.1 transcription factor A, mitochondrial isoform X1 [Oncorhynchus kisutch]